MAKKISKTPIDYYNKNEKSMENQFPGLVVIVKKLSQSPQLSHASNILAKAIELHKNSNVSKEEILRILICEYVRYINNIEKIKGYSEGELGQWAEELDKYYDFFESKQIEKTFDSRGKIRSTILEEFTYLFLRNKVDEIVKKYCGNDKDEIICGAAKAYSNLYITGKDLKSFIQKPLVKINVKDQDYAIYRKIPIVIPDKNSHRPVAAIVANVPILAVENKTFLDKTMLEGAVATAEKIKSGNPYSTFIVITETYAVADDVDPVYSRIDQIFVLRKCKHDKTNRLSQKIAPDVLGKFIALVERRLTGVWSDVSSRMKNDGTIM